MGGVLALCVTALVLASTCFSQGISGGGTNARPETESVLLRIRAWEGGWASPCIEDGRATRDTSYIRVRRGESFTVNGSLGAFFIAQVAPGEVEIELPDDLISERSSSSLVGPLQVTRDPVAVGTTQVDDGGGGVEFSVVDSLPKGAREGLRGARDPWAAFKAQDPVIVETRPAVVPKSYAGPWGTVRVRVTLDGSGKVAGMAVDQSVSRVLDASALTATRAYKFRLGTPCRGFDPIRSLVVDFPFKSWQR